MRHAAEAQAIVMAAGIGRIVLVTHATHMRRSVRAFLSATHLRRQE